MKAVCDLPERPAQILSLLFEQINPIEYSWALTGSAGLRLQGIDVPVHDLDLQTDRKTIYMLEEKLSDFMMVPVHAWESEHTRSYHGQALVNGLQVELLGDVRHRSPEGRWELSVEIASSREWIDWRGLMIPVLPLRQEALAYEKMGRSQRADLIRSALRKESL